MRGTSDPFSIILKVLSGHLSTTVNTKTAQSGVSFSDFVLPLAANKFEWLQINIINRMGNNHHALCCWQRTKTFVTFCKQVIHCNCQNHGEQTQTTIAHGKFCRAPGSALGAPGFTHGAPLVQISAKLLVLLQTYTLLAKLKQKSQNYLPGLPKSLRINPDPSFPQSAAKCIQH